jgi:hypothetical protein
MQRRYDVLEGDEGDRAHLAEPLLEHVDRKYQDCGGFDANSAEAERDDQKAMKQLAMASGVCAFFLICELIGGYIANSLAIMTDAAHLFSDITGFLISIMAMVRSTPSPPPSPRASPSPHLCLVSISLGGGPRRI